MITLPVLYWTAAQTDEVLSRPMEVVSGPETEGTVTGRAGTEPELALTLEKTTLNGRVETAGPVTVPGIEVVKGPVKTEAEMFTETRELGRRVFGSELGTRDDTLGAVLASGPDDVPGAVLTNGPLPEGVSEVLVRGEEVVGGVLSARVLRLAGRELFVNRKEVLGSRDEVVTGAAVDSMSAETAPMTTETVAACSVVGVGAAAVEYTGVGASVEYTGASCSVEYTGANCSVEYTGTSCSVVASSSVV